MKTNYLNRLVVSCLLLAGSFASLAAQSPKPLGGASTDSWVLLKTTTANKKWKFSVAKASGSGSVWIDLNNNGTCDEGEAVEEFGTILRYPVDALEVKIYGKLTSLSLEPVITQGVGGAKEGNHLIEVAFHKCDDLTSLNLKGNELTQISFTSAPDINNLNKKGELNTPNLEELVLDQNKLEKLDLTGMTKLYSVDASDNLLKAITLPAFDEEVSLSLRNNKFTSLDVTGVPNLWSIGLDNNELTSITLGRQEVLEELSLSGNKLSALDVSQCSALSALYVCNNNFYELNLSGLASLERLECQNNKLTSLNLEGCAKMRFLYAYGNRLNGDVASTLVTKLPTQTAEYPGQLYFVDLKADPVDDNRLKTSDVTALKARHWNIYDNNGGKPKAYSGDDTPIATTTYSVTLKTVGNGTAELQVDNGLDLTKLPKGTVVTVTFTRPDGFWLESLVANGKNLKKKDPTTGKRYQVVVEEDLEIVATFAKCPYTTDQPHMTFTTEMTPGEGQWAFEFYGTYFPDGQDKSTTWIDFNGNGKFDETEESAKKNGSFKRTVDAQTLTIYGAIKMIVMVNQGLTAVETKDNPDLRSLFVNRNNLTKLDVSGNKILRYLFLDNNKITDLKFDAPNLVKLSFSDNQLKKDAVANIIKQLPNRNKALPGDDEPTKGEMYVKFLESPTEGNEVDAFWVNIAKSLNWDVIALSLDPEDHETILEAPYDGEHVGVTCVENETLEVTRCDNILVVTLPESLIGYDMMLYNAEGIAVREVLPMQQTYTIDVADLPRGGYLLSIAGQALKLNL